MNQVKSKDSNSKQGSELLEAVGGLEAAQAIVNNAPEGATHYATNEAGFNYYKREPFRSSVWIDDYWQSLFDDFDVCSQRYIGLSDLRIAIADQSSKSGLWVVKNLSGQVLHSTSNLDDAIHWKKSFGLVGSNYEISFNDSASKRICIEEEPLSHFQSKHCSPRLLEHMKFDVPVVPASKPGCTECTVKDHDLTVLRKLQASNLSTYAKRVHSQQTHILIREVIICVLVIACIGLVLWGLR